MEFGQKMATTGYYQGFPFVLQFQVVLIPGQYLSNQVKIKILFK